ncbi:MAG: SufE family protein [Bacteriovoracales bacterium]|nr:SufE family protein [Bacteriovoracales bacterium]
MGIETRKQEIIKRFQYFEHWDDRYRQLIHYGKKLPSMPDEAKISRHLVPGCVSKVWLHHEWKEGRVFFQADSDATITKGIVGVLLHVYSGATPPEITGTPPDFLKEIGLDEHLSINRRNGLANMSKIIREKAALYL